MPNNLIGVNVSSVLISEMAEDGSEETMFICEYSSSNDKCYDVNVNALTGFTVLFLFVFVIYCTFICIHLFILYF